MRGSIMCRFAPALTEIVAVGFCARAAVTGRRTIGARQAAVQSGAKGTLPFDIVGSLREVAVKASGAVDHRVGPAGSERRQAVEGDIRLLADQGGVSFRRSFVIGRAEREPTAAE